MVVHLVEVTVPCVQVQLIVTPVWLDIIKMTAEFVLLVEVLVELVRMEMPVIPVLLGTLIKVAEHVEIVLKIALSAPMKILVLCVAQGSLMTMELALAALKIACSVLMLLLVFIATSHSN